MTMKTPKAPAGLSSESKRLWTKLHEEYDLTDPASMVTLRITCEALDRLRQLQKSIDEDGPTVTDKWNQKKVHPALSAERDTRAAILAGLKALCLDIEPLRSTIGRPPGR